MKKLLSKNIFKQSVRNNWKLWAILTGVLCFFITVMTLVMGTRTDTGRGPGSMDLMTIYSMMFFGTSAMGAVILIIYSVTVGNKLVASEVDKGTMSFSLNTPTTRKQLIFSKALFYIVSIALMIVLVGLFGTVSSLIVGININLGKLWLIILGFFLYSFAICGICFFASCWFNKSGQAIMIGAGLPVAFILFSTLSSLMKEFKFLKYFSLSTLYDTSNIIAGTNFIIQFIVMFAIGAVLFAIGINKFLKKDLPL